MEYVLGAEATIQGETAEDALDVAAVLHVVFPDMQFSLNDLDTDGTLWSIPTNADIYQQVMEENEDWSATDIWNQPGGGQILVSLHIPTADHHPEA